MSFDKKMQIPLINNNDFENIDDFEIVNNEMPHKKSLEIIIINIREMIYILLQKLIKKENPILYINSSPDRFFTCSIILIILGTLLLLLSGLMIN